MVKLAVVGAGAMGGSLAGHATRAGHQVTLVDVAADVVAHVNRSGVRVETPEGPFTATVAATSQAGDVGPVDVVALFVKSQHTSSAAASLAPLITESTTVVTLQNGWGNADLVAQSVAPEQIVVGVTYNSCTLDGPGCVIHSGRGPTVVGPYKGAELARAATVAALLNESGWETTASPDVITAIWKKLVLNSATLPTSALTRLPAGALGEPGELRDLLDDLAAEAVTVARALGLDIDFAERREAIHQVLAKAGAGKASMLQDVLGGRKTEIETVNAAIVAAGKSVALPTPLNGAMVALVHGLERGYLS